MRGALVGGGVLVVAIVVGWTVRGPTTTTAQRPATQRVEERVRGETDGRAARATLPRGRTAADAPVQLTPGAEGYDGVRAAMWLGLSNVQLFEREPRDELWAAAMEGELGAVVEREARAVGLDASLVEAECHTSSCRTVIEIGADDREDAMLYFQALAPLGTTVSFDVIDRGDDRVTVAFMTAFDTDMRAPADYRAFLAEYQRRSRDKIDAWRSHRRGRSVTP